MEKDRFNVLMLRGLALILQVLLLGRNPESKLFKKAEEWMEAALLYAMEG